MEFDHRAGAGLKLFTVYIVVDNLKLVVVVSVAVVIVQLENFRFCC